MILILFLILLKIPPFFKLFRRLIKKEEWLERRRVLTENVFPALKEVVEKEDLDIFKGQLDNIEVLEINF